MIQLGEEIAITATYLNTIHESDDFLILSMKATYDDTKFPMASRASEMMFCVKGKFVKPSYPQQLIEIVGEWMYDNKRGEYTFVVQYAIPCIPIDEAGSLAFLNSIKGIGKKIATRIWNNYKSLEAAAYDANVLAASIKGLSSSAALALCNAVKDANTVAELTKILKDLVTGDVIKNIVIEYGTDALQQINDYPYQMCEKRIITFASADAIALFLGYNKEDPERLRVGVMDCVRMLKYKSSSIIVEKDLLISLAVQALGLSEERIKAAMEKLRANKMIVSANPYVYLYEDYKSECNLAENIVNLTMLKTRPRDELAYINNYNEWTKQNPDVKVAEKQDEAIRAVANNVLTVLTGGPGTGKTTILQIMISVYKKTFPKNAIDLMAPTGLAAKRMTENCNIQAHTAHKALNLTPSQNNESGFNSTEGVTIIGGLIIIDEASMVGLHLAQFIFDSILSNPETRIVIVGDIDQLPSVSPGSVLDDLITCGKVKVTRLDRNFRQEAGSAIVDAAIAINNGAQNIKYEGNFQLAEISDNNLATETKCIFEEIKAAFSRSIKKFGLDQTYVLTPQRKCDTRTEQKAIGTLLSANSINPVLRDMINPPSSEKSFVKCGGKLFREGDRVINLKNTDKLINGDIGMIKRIVIAEGATVTIDFYGQEVEFNHDALKGLDLAYAITIHKSQGCEFDSIIIPMSLTQKVMLQRNLLYTAVTRAKKQSLIIGNKSAVSLAIRTTKQKTKKDLLAARIAKYYMTTNKEIA